MRNISLLPIILINLYYCKSRLNKVVYQQYFRYFQKIIYCGLLYDYEIDSYFLHINYVNNANNFNLKNMCIVMRFAAF